MLQSGAVAQSNYKAMTFEVLQQKTDCGCPPYTLMRRLWCPIDYDQKVSAPEWDWVCPLHPPVIPMTSSIQFLRCPYCNDGVSMFDGKGKYAKRWMGKHLARYHRKTFDKDLLIYEKMVEQGFDWSAAHFRYSNEKIEEELDKEALLLMGVL